MKTTVKRQFGMERHAEFLAVKHTHDLLAKMNHGGAAHRFLVKAWRSNEHTWKSLAKSRCRLRSHFQGLVGKAVAPCGLGFLIGGFGDIKTDIDHGLERFSLTTPCISSDTGRKVRRTSFVG